MEGADGSSIEAGSAELAPMLPWGEFARIEEARRKEGDRGGVAPPTLFKELRDVLFSKVGVVDRALLAMELELGVRRRGLLGICIRPYGEGAACNVACPLVCVINGEAGRAVSAAAASESRLTLSESDVSLLFVDWGMFVS